MLMIGKRAIGLALALLAAAVIVSGASAAEKAKPAAALKGPVQAEATYDDPLGRSTPQGTVVGFLKAMQREDYERAVDYLDTRQTGKRAEQLALELYYILNEGMSTVTTALSIKPEGNLQDNLPDNRELVGTVKTKRGEYRILLERVQKENNPPVWHFSRRPSGSCPRSMRKSTSPGSSGIFRRRCRNTALPVNRCIGGSYPSWCFPWRFFSAGS